MSLEKKKLQVELMRVKTARMELECRIEERQEEILRVQEHIVIQQAKEDELQVRLDEMKITNKLV